MNYSVIIPFKNEESNVKELIEELEPIMASLEENWELICIDDGSTDCTLPLLQDLAKNRKQMRIIAFDKNYGQSSALDAGFKAASGKFVITLDGDRQNDPHDIPKMIAAMGDYDMICGRRAKRRDSWSKKITSMFANQVRKRVCQDGVQDTGCSLKIYRAGSLKKIKMYQGMHRFLPALFQIEGFKVKEMDVNHRERTRGVTKYNIFNRSINTVFDMLAVLWMRKRQLRYKIK